VNRNEFAKEVIQTLHCHWRNYCEMLAKPSDENFGLKTFKYAAAKINIDF